MCIEPTGSGVSLFLLIGTLVGLIMAFTDPLGITTRLDNFLSKHRLPVAITCILAVLVFLSLRAIYCS